MRESWIDDRLDDLNGKVDLLRVETRTEFKAVRAEAREEFSAVRRELREGFDRVDARLQAMDERLLATHRMIIGFCGLTFTALIGVVATLVTQI